MGDVLQVIQSLVVLLAAPLFAGVLARAEAVVQCKRGPERAPAVPRSAQASAQGQRDLRSGVVDLSRRARRRLRLLPDGLGDRPDHHRRAAAARVPGRPDRRRVRAQPGELRDLAGRAGHRQPARRPRRQPHHLAWQLRRACADPGLLHGRRAVTLRQPVFREPCDRALGRSLRTAHAPARSSRVLHAGARRDRPIPIDNPSGRSRSR